MIEKKWIIFILQAALVLGCNQGRRPNDAPVQPQHISGESQKVFFLICDSVKNAPDSNPAKVTVNAVQRQLERTESCSDAQIRLEKIKRLDLNDSQISDLRPLANLDNLKYLRLSNNQISDVSPLATLKHLRRLWIDRNFITDATPLENLKELTFVDMSLNKGISRRAAALRRVLTPANVVAELNQNDFRFNDKTERCERDGEPGLNVGYLGECTDMSGMDLHDANLHKSQLSGSDMIDADLKEANLRDSQLNYCNLSNADLRAAQLSNANLFKADLRGADLRGAQGVNQALLSFARYNGKTRLPFGEKEAKARNMVFDPGP